MAVEHYAVPYRTGDGSIVESTFVHDTDANDAAITVGPGGSALTFYLVQADDGRFRLGAVRATSPHAPELTEVGPEEILGLMAMLRAVLDKGAL